MAIQDGDWVTYIDRILLEADIWEEEQDRKWAAAERDWPKAQAEGLSIKEWRAKYNLDPDWGEPLTEEDKRSLERAVAQRVIERKNNQMDPRMKWGLIAAGVGLLWFMTKDRK